MSRCDLCGICGFEDEPLTMTIKGDVCETCFEVNDLKAQDPDAIRDAMRDREWEDDH